MKQGTLIYDEENGRYDVCLGLNNYYGGLHCGETFDVLINGAWKPARIEMGKDWYLAGMETLPLSGLWIRI